MSNKFRRFEILLPLLFNDGQPIPESLIAETLAEIRDRFGAVSAEKQSIQGQWRHQGQTYRDDLTRIFVDVSDIPESLEFFHQFKEILKARFQQIDIWMTSYPVDVI